MLPHVIHRAGFATAFIVGLTAMVAAGSGAAEPLGAPPGKGKGKDPEFAADRAGFQFLLANRAVIKRTVTETKTGVETLTESAKPEVARQIQEHVEAMHARIKSGQGIHYRDPLFAEIFRHYDKIDLKIEKTKNGVRVTESSDDPYVAKLIQAHARAVTKFIENGHAEVRKNHPLPDRTETGKP
jgi:hypothetical protein